MRKQQELFAVCKGWCAVDALPCRCYVIMNQLSRVIRLLARNRKQAAVRTTTSPNEAAPMLGWFVPGPDFVTFRLGLLSELKAPESLRQLSDHTGRRILGMARDGVAWRRGRWFHCGQIADSAGLIGLRSAAPGRH